MKPNKAQGLTASNYFRSLLIQDLKSRNLLTQEVLESLVRPQTFYTATATVMEVLHD